MNTSEVGVSCKGPGTFFSKSSKGFAVKGRAFLISIEDPQAPENDIGKNSFGYFQVRSAFAMAFSTLTNAKTILSLGLNRSILGTIIRPEPVLVERKGGANGEVTFGELLPGAGEAVQVHSEEQQMYCNWQLHDEEEPLPRGNGTAAGDGGTGTGTPSSSGKRKKKTRTKASEEEKPAKMLKANGEARKVRHEESGSKRDKGKKKTGYPRDGSGSNSSRSRRRSSNRSPSPRKE